MSIAGKAVFLSYASQDAEAAKKICEALRSAGVEVWFDQSELRGGDAWDQKIRRQIRECALFVPVISRNTQARPEGYFRLEWHLAEQRSLLIAKGRPFLVPVTIDETSDRDALVPDAFVAVQWMKAPGGECSAAFVENVRRVLSGDVARPAPRTSPPAPGPAATRGGKPKLAVVLAAVVVLGAVAALIWSSRERTNLSVTSSSAPAPEIAALRARIVPDRWQKGDFEAVDATLERLLQQNPENADAWALRSIICSLQTMRLIDRGTKPLQIGRRAAERAQSLAPDSPLANLALGYHLTANINRGGDPEAGRAPMARAVAALPPDGMTRYGALASVWNAYDLAGTERVAREWLAADPTATFPSWVMASKSAIAREPEEVLCWGGKATSDPNITGVRAFSTMFDAHFYLRADLPAAAAMLERVPPRGRNVPRIVFCRWLICSAQGRHDDALQALAAVPEPFIGDVSYAGPKATLAGFSHRWAGRPEPALVQFREAERQLREQLAIDAENEEFRAGLALTLAAQGRAAEARAELALVEPVLRGRAPSLYRGQLFSFVMLVHAQLGDGAAASYYARRIFSEPSNPPHTPASLRQDPRFHPIVDAPEMQALFQEFAALDPRPADIARITSDDKSVAVLAFANLSEDKANEYFSDGISEELLNVLAKVPGLKVSARTSAFFFKGKNTPIPEIAKQLGVAYVVEGSVRRAGEKVRITAQLIKAADGFHVWSETFTRDLKDVFAVQDEIAGLIAKNLSLRMGVASSAPALDAEVLPLYYAALQAWNLRTLEGMDRAEALLNDALARAPQFARGHAALAAVWLIRGEITDTVSPFGLRASPLAQKIAAKLEEALQLDPRCAEAYAVRGALGWDTWAWDAGLADLRRATELNPNFASAHQWMGRILACQGRLDEAIASLRRAVEVDPLSPRILDNYGRLFICAGRPREALVQAERALELQPGAVQALGVKAEALALLGQHEAAAEIALRLPTEMPIVSIYKVGVLAKTGPREQLADMLPRMTPGGHISQIAALVALGRVDEAAAAVDPAWFTATRWDMALFSPLFDPLRAHPRWATLLTELGQTEGHARAQAWRAAHPVAKSSP
jgi:TolB-like protein/cytochrome c-type biogenesis protein CcmH/NrfG